MQHVSLLEQREEKKVRIEEPTEPKVIMRTPQQQSTSALAKSKSKSVKQQVQTDTYFLSEAVKPQSSLAHAIPVRNTLPAGFVVPERMQTQSSGEKQQSGLLNMHKQRTYND